VSRRLPRFMLAGSLALTLLSVLPATAIAAPIAAGDGQQTIAIASLDMTVFTYRPNCANPTLLLVFHGRNRNADRYRDFARALADRLCMLVVAPRFDKARFPTWRYQRGGLVHRDVVQPRGQWSGPIVLEIVDWVSKQEGSNLDYSMIGHSAGGQFLSRLAAFVPNQAKRIVIANAGTYVFPSLSTKASYGFGGIYSASAGEAELRRYLVQPLTIFLGQEDTGDEDRNDSPQAVAQGETRYQRGRNVYREAQELAQARGWTFNWRLLELPGVGHSARKMFSSPQAAAALAP
jgi:pimeloyl-ACP methyl ester carboxylesterase